MQKLRPDMNIGKNIQTIRKSKKMTQEQTIAKLQLMGLPITKSTYAKIETNRMNIRVSELVALKIIFDVPYDKFFDELTAEIAIPPEF